MGLEFLDRFKERPEVCIVSLAQNLWRSYLEPKNWAPAPVGTAYVIFVKRGFMFPGRSSPVQAGRFETLRNTQKALQMLFRSASNPTYFETSWIVRTL